MYPKPYVADWCTSHGGVIQAVRTGDSNGNVSRWKFQFCENPGAPDPPDGFWKAVKLIQEYDDRCFFELGSIHYGDLVRGAIK